MARGCEQPQREAAPAESDAELSGGLHWAVLLLWPSAQLLPLVVLLLAGDIAGVVAGVLIVGGLAANLLRWRRFSWRLEHDTLVVERGLLQRQRRVIPIERVQSVDMVRDVRHRLLSVAELRVETIGGGSVEGRLDALPVDVANRLRDALLRRQAEAPRGDGEAPRHAAPHGQVLARMTPGRLVLAGVTGGRVGVAAALLGGAQQLVGDRIATLPGVVPRLGAAVAVLLVVVALAGVFLLSVAATAVAYWDFTLVRDGNTLRVRRGLLQQRLETVPLDRIQSLRMEENLARRPLGLAAVKVDVAGRAGGRNARDTGLLLPLGTRSQARRLIADVLQEPGVLDEPLTAAPPRARRRRLTRALLAAALLTTAAVAAAGAAGLTVAASIAPAVLLALEAYRALGRGRFGGYLVTRDGVVVRRTAVVAVRRLQELRLKASPLQRLAGLATLELRIARSPGGWRGPRMLDVDAEEASLRQHRLAGELFAPPVAAGDAAEADPPAADPQPDC